MNEKEKMLAGMLYNGVDEILINERQKAKVELFKLNNLSPLNLEERTEILKNLLGKMGNNIYIEPPFRCDYGYNISIGDNFYSNYNLIILDCNKVNIGNNVYIGPNVGIYTAAHPIQKETRNMGIEYAKEINIGSDVWIGGNVTINPGVKIGDNVVIGSGSVVTKDIPSNVVACGNPCKVIKDI